MRSDFVSRHIGPDDREIEAMLGVVAHAVGVQLGDLDALTTAATPATIRSNGPLDLHAALDEPEALARLAEFADANVVRRSMIGLGYYDTFTPGVILRNVLENPGWYTAYTPYQPEISQGRLEALLNFQTMVTDLTGMALANSSMLDEATAAAEAMALVRRSTRAKPDAAFVVDEQVLPQTLAVIRTRARASGVDVVVADLAEGPAALDAALDGRTGFGILVQYPAADGQIRDDAALFAAAAEAKMGVVAAADLLALTLLRPPGEIGADVVVGTTQRFGVPMGFGGPHAGYLAVRTGLERTMPGRLVGVSQDADGRPAYRLALQTREQHIRREKATSNICTAQVLLAVMASMYAVYHGPIGLREIAERVHDRTLALGERLRGGGLDVVHEQFFDTIMVTSPAAGDLVTAAADAGYLLRRVSDTTFAVSCDETTTRADVAKLAAALGCPGPDATAGVMVRAASRIPEDLRRTSDYLTHPVFNTHHSETSMLRYLRTLADKDYALDRGMIPLGSCTMKLNATTEMEPVTWPEFSRLHPFAPQDDATGMLEMIGELCDWLAEITGYAKISVQPNAGSQGELAGLMAIRAFHKSRGEEARTVCLIPGSAHGTNAASAVMAGLRVVVVATDGLGNIDVDDLKVKVDKHRDDLAAIMVTYPSTHGVYEEAITDICRLIHDAGGQVYVDGANLNALVGVAKPGEFGSDVSHLNLHKTFCIPHGGGGPGVGPIGVGEHLIPFLPSEDVLDAGDDAAAVGPVSAAPFGSASILPITWAYIAMMGPAGLRRATQVAVLNANYVAARLGDHYPVLYTGPGGLVAHECIIDLRPLTKSSGVTVDDVAKRLIDYGFHAPTMSFPVAGTLMVEPTESENLGELDRFCDAMIAIRAEAADIESGRVHLESSALRGAPHTARCLTEDWDVPYSRADAVYPGGVNPASKYWPATRRIDGAYGDRNLVCSCPPIEELAE